MKHTTFQIIAAFIGLLTASGVFIHDSQIDKAVGIHSSLSFSHKAVAADVGPVDPHVHPSNPGKTLLKHFGAHSNPAYPPREQRIRRHAMHDAEPRGRHAFDSQFLPIVG